MVDGATVDEGRAADIDRHVGEERSDLFLILLSGLGDLFLFCSTGLVVLVVGAFDLLHRRADLERAAGANGA